MSVFEADLHLGFDVPTAHCERGAARRAAPGPEESFKEIAESTGAAYTSSENIAEVAVLDPRALPPSSAIWRPSRRRREIGPGLPVGAELIVAFAFFRIGEDFVGLTDLLELFFRRFVVGINVRMVFAREFAIRLLNLVRGRCARDAQSLVIVVKLYCHKQGLAGRGSGRRITVYQLPAAHLPPLSISPRAHAPDAALRRSRNIRGSLRQAPFQVCRCRLQLRPRLREASGRTPGPPSQSASRPAV